MRPARGRPPKTWQSAVNTFVNRKRITEKTRKKYKANYTGFFTALEEAGLETLPAKIGQKEIDYLFDTHWAHLEDSTKKWYAKILAMFLRYHHNHIFEDLNIAYPNDARVNVDWLSASDMITLIDAPMSPMQALAIHLELCLCLRRVECIRLRLIDIHSDHVTVRGKGRKQRTVPFHPDTKRLLREWLTERNEIITQAKEIKPSIKIPDQVFIWSMYKQKVRIGAYSENGDAFDDAVKIPVSEMTGIKFSNHTLRRTGGRMMWKSGNIPIETIAKIYGHSSTTTTERYIGVNFDDMDQAMDAFSEYQKTLRKSKGEMISND